MEVSLVTSNPNHEEISYSAISSIQNRGEMKMKNGAWRKLGGLPHSVLEVFLGVMFEVSSLSLNLAS